jgi:DNA-binding CsgD family transcriptional regulator
MTRLLYLPDDATVIQFEVEISASQLCAAVNAGMRPVPVLRNAPAERLTAHQMAGTVIVAPAALQAAALKPEQKISGLSRRQAQVHDLSSRGLTSGEIAVMLHLSRRTVNYHLNQVKNRLRGGECAQPPMRMMPLKFKED